MLRSPNEIVTASKVSSANGSRVPSPAVNGRCGRCPLADLEHAEREVARARPRRRASANGWLEVPVPAARSSTRSPGCGVDGADDLAAPATVLAERQHVVGDVVALGDGVEHPPDVGRLLVEVCAGHAQSVGRARYAGCAGPVTGRTARRGNQIHGFRVFRIETEASSPRLRTRIRRRGRGLPRRRTMRVVKALLTLVLVAGPRRRRGVRRRRRDAAPRPAHRRRVRPPAPRARLDPDVVRAATPSSPTPRRRALVAAAVAEPVADVLRAGRQGHPGARAPGAAAPAGLAPRDHDRVYDDATVAAVKGFQAKRGLDRTGVLDRRTWQRLVAMTDRPSHDAMFNVLHPGRTLFGPGDHGDEVRDLQARLRQIAWYFGDVTGSYDDATVDRGQGLPGQAGHPGHRRGRPAHPRPAARDDRARRRHDELHNDAEPSPRQARPALPAPGGCSASTRPAAPCAGSSTGTCCSTLDARFGSTSTTPRPARACSTSTCKDADHVSQLYGSSMPYSMFFSGGQAVHYSSDFAARRLRRRLARLREHPRLRRHQVAVLPGARRRQGRRLLVLTLADPAP